MHGLGGVTADNGIGTGAARKTLRPWWHGKGGMAGASAGEGDTMAGGGKAREAWA